MIHPSEQTIALHRPRHLVERRTDALLDLRADEYLGRRIATDHVRAHVPRYANPDDHATFEAYLEWVTELHETDCRPLIDRRAARA